MRRIQGIRRNNAVKRIETGEANIPSMTRRVESGVVGESANPGSTRNARMGEKGIRVRSDLPKVIERLVENMVLFVIELQEQVNVLAPGIEGPVVSENALQGSLGGRRVSPFAEQSMGFLGVEFHGAERKRGSARTGKRASREGAAGAASEEIPSGIERVCQ